jgi:hypothetical protein
VTKSFDPADLLTQVEALVGADGARATELGGDVD